MRKTVNEEQAIREKVMQYIETKARQQNRVAYYSPTQVKSMLEQWGVTVSVDYIIRRYAELNIKLDRGLWLQEIE